MAYTCNQCPENFKQNKSYKKHLKIHVDVDVYPKCETFYPSLKRSKSFLKEKKKCKRVFRGTKNIKENYEKERTDQIENIQKYENDDMDKNYSANENCETDNENIRTKEKDNIEILENIQTYDNYGKVCKIDIISIKDENNDMDEFPQNENFKTEKLPFENIQMNENTKDKKEISDQIENIQTYANYGKVCKIDVSFIKNEIDVMNENEYCNIEVLGDNYHEEIKKENLSQDDIGEGIAYKCTVCDYKTTKKWYVKRHMESVHLEIKYDCEQCDYKATRKNYLVTHVASVHEGVTYDCKLCDYKATNKRYLKIHVESHHEGIQHDCKQCAYSGSTKLGLVNHIKKVHEEVRFYCDQCDYIANKNYTLSYHVASKHEGITYDCQHCEYKGNDKLHLSRHLKNVHKKCEYCGYQSIRKNDLKQHVAAIHEELLKELGVQAEEKPYFCNFCAKSFAKDGYLKQHFKHMHKGEHF